MGSSDDHKIPRLILKAGREKSLVRRHPWVFSGAVASVTGAVAPGQTVDLIDNQGQFLGRAAYNPTSQISARVWTWDEHEKVDANFFARRLKKSIDSRGATCPDVGPAGAIRLVYAESDGLPGLIVDRYADYLVVQFLSAGAENWRYEIIEQLETITGIHFIYERSDVDVRRLEGLPEKTGVLRGTPPPEDLVIVENGIKVEVDIINGHKSGAYLDQRLNRFHVRELSRNREVLDCFCYTGGFTLNSVVGGAKSVLSIDASESAVIRAQKNLFLNNPKPIPPITWLVGDVFTELRTLRDKNQYFDMVILDPPKFAPTSAQLERAARGYKDINLLAMKLLRPGGILVTFSCSGGVSSELFQKIVAGAALDAKVSVQILEWLHQSPDHPVALNFPESAYLKGLVLRVN